MAKMREARFHDPDRHLAWLTFPEAVEDRVFSLGFATWNVMGIPLIARVKPMTVRKMGAVFTEMMATLGRQDLSELRFRVAWIRGSEQERRRVVHAGSHTGVRPSGGGLAHPHRA